jgi:hypothetical protein
MISFTKFWIVSIFCDVIMIYICIFIEHLDDRFGAC